LELSQNFAIDIVDRWRNHSSQQGAPWFSPY
jgi:hypothetical protein